MTLITDSITGRWQSTDKNDPGHIARMYGGGLKEHALTHLCATRIQAMDFADIELRILAYFSGHDPRNHIGKFAHRSKDE